MVHKSQSARTFAKRSLQQQEYSLFNEQAHSQENNLEVLVLGFALNMVIFSYIFRFYTNNSFMSEVLNPSLWLCPRQWGNSAPINQRKPSHLRPNKYTLTINKAAACMSNKPYGEAVLCHTNGENGSKRFPSTSTAFVIIRAWKYTPIITLDLAVNIAHAMQAQTYSTGVFN